jgi:hypothetical protein
MRENLEQKSNAEMLIMGSAETVTIIGSAETVTTGSSETVIRSSLQLILSNP